MGFRAPQVFALILVAVDLLLRLTIIEKRPAAKILLANPEYDLPKFEAPKEVMELLETRKQQNGRLDSEQANETVDELAKRKQEHKPSSREALSGLLQMLTSWRANTLFAVTLLSGIMMVGLFETGLTIHVVELYDMSASVRPLTHSLSLFHASSAHSPSLSPQQAGLLFIALIVPNALFGPLCGWLADRRGGKLTMS